MRYYIIEDEVILSELIVRYLETRAGHEFLGSSINGNDGLQRVKELKPDMVLVDLKLPGLGGIEIAKQIKEHLPHIKIIIFSAFIGLPILRELLDTQVDGIVEKTCGPEELATALDTVHRGHTYYSEYIFSLVRQLRSEGKSNEHKLTTREREIVRLIAESCSSRTISEKLAIAVKTVEAHRTNAMRKLGLHDVAALTRWAISNQLTLAEEFSHSAMKAKSTPAQETGWIPHYTPKRQNAGAATAQLPE